jgi:hypothetical protein
MKMTEQERNAFIEKNAGIIGDIITKPFKKKGGSYKVIAELYGYQYEDVFNSGVIGMIEGIEKYDIKKATKEDGSIVPLEAFVRIDVHRAISEFTTKWRKHDRLENKVSMQETLSHCKVTGRPLTVEDMLAEEQHNDNFCNEMDYDKVQNILDSGILSEVESIAIRERFINGLKFREIDVLVQKFLGNPKARAFYFINTALDKLREALSVYS